MPMLRVWSPAKHMHTHMYTEDRSGGIRTLTMISLTFYYPFTVWIAEEINGWRHLWVIWGLMAIICPSLCDTFQHILDRSSEPHRQAGTWSQYGPSWLLQLLCRCYLFHLRIWLTGLEEPIVDGRVLRSETFQGHPCISARCSKFFVLGTDSKNSPPSASSWHR